MTKHTPGPWSLGTPGREHENAHMCEVMTTGVTKNSGASLGCHDIICRTWSPDYMAASVRIDRATCMANARLIAAAPDMLALLEDIAMGDAYGSIWKEQAQAVVAKATGG